MHVAFHAPAPVARALRRPRPSCASHRVPSVPVCASAAPSRLSRRAVLQTLPAAAALLSGVLPAAADRTGKMSTKLTAKRRYIPRIAAGVAALRALRIAGDGWEGEVRGFVEGPAADLKFAMPLFATTFFSEGNRIGEKEKLLKAVEDRFFAAVEVMRKAKEVDAARVAWENAMKEAAVYVKEAGLREAVDGS